MYIAPQCWDTTFQFGILDVQHPLYLRRMPRNISEILTDFPNRNI